MQSKSTFPARIAPFSVLEPLASILPSGTEKGAIRAGNVDFTLHCCISITDKVKINDLQKSIVTGLLYVHIDFEVIWTFLQGATWILNPSGYCAL